MKKNLYAIAAALVLLSSCGGNTKPSTTPVHRQEPSIVATTPDEMRNVMADMLNNPDASQSMSADLRSITDEAAHLIIGNTDNTRYTPFDWYGKQLSDDSQQHSNDVGDIHVSSDSVTIEMTYSDATHKVPYILVMKHEQGKWLIDDIVWTGQQPPLDTERHAAGAYADEAINRLTTGDAQTAVNRINDLATQCKSNPTLIPGAVKDIETALHYLKENRGYTEDNGKAIEAILQQLKK